MSQPVSGNTADSVTTVSKWNYLPCVQYGFPKDEGPIREPKLKTIYDPIPEGATTVSPIYRLTRDQYERQDRFKTGYEVSGCNSIATELQDKCENANHVLYPIHIESDVYHDEGPQTLIEWFREFIEEYLEVPFYSCTIYFSGHRSIHAHVPRFLSGEDHRKKLKEMASNFCEETRADLDCGIYSRKRLFRIPGVGHEKSTLPKVEIEPEWDHDRIISKATTEGTVVPKTYADVLQRIFVSQEELIVNSSEFSVDNLLHLFRILDSDKTVLDLSSNEQEIELPLIECEQCPTESRDVLKWSQYNAKEFSPYANADGNPRSVAAVKVKGGAFARKEKRNGATMIPAYFYGAISCDDQFTKEQKHAPLQLSKRDYQKWDYEVGEHIVIIGGRSRNSRIMCVDSWTATVVGHALTGESASREAALDHLVSEGHDIGEEGSSQPASTGRQESTQNSITRRQNTEAAALQRQAEKEGIETLSHKEQFRVACRLLRFGWEPAWEWFKQQFGAKFKPDLTRRYFLDVINRYPEDYTHVELPRS